jgi:hypothetical protein
MDGYAKRSTVIVLFSGFSFPNTGGKTVSRLTLSAVCLSQKALGQPARKTLKHKIFIIHAANCQPTVVVESSIASNQNRGEHHEDKRPKRAEG